MSIHCVGVTPSDDHRYQKMLLVVKACDDAGVSYPREAEEYFDDPESPETRLETEIPCTEYDTDWCAGYEVNVKDIPKGVEKIRFYYTY